MRRRCYTRVPGRSPFTPQRPQSTPGQGHDTPRAPAVYGIRSIPASASARTLGVMTVFLPLKVLTVAEVGSA
jgi:hypothetical protein